MKIIHFPIIESTSSYLLEHPEIDDFTPVVSDIQTKGRGYRGREWYSLDRGGLYMSIYIPYSIKLPGFKALYRIMLHFLPMIRVNWKWPNDIMYNGKKIGGILVEEKKGRGYVLGIGLNFNQKTFPDYLNATSLFIEKKHHVSFFPFIYYFTYSMQMGIGTSSLLNFLWPFLIKEVELNDGTFGEILKLNEDGSVLVQTNKGYETFYSKDRLL